MWEALQSEATKDFTKDDCLVVVIMSHGDRGVVMGTDGGLLQIEEITRLFGQIKDLYGKPKLFIYQACQGSESTPFCKIYFELNLNLSF